MAEKRIHFGSVKTDRGLDGIIEVSVTETINLNKVSKSLAGSLKRALRNGVAPVEDSSQGKLATLYRIVCDKFDMPMAFLSKSSSEVVVYNYSEELLEEFNAMHMISGSKTRVLAFNNYFKDYNTRVTQVALTELVARHRPVDSEKLEQALLLIKQGAKISFEPHQLHP